MKKILSIMFLLMVFVISLFSQQTNNLERQNIDSLVQIIGSEKIPTGTLLIISEKKLNDFDEKLFDKSTWMQLFFELRNATIEREKNVMTINEIARLSSRYLHSDIIPIRVLSKKINTISSDRLQEKLLQGIDVSDIGTSDIFAASASQDYSLNGQEQKFILPSELLFLSEKNATKYFIDFDDGRGFRSIVPDRLITVSYSSIGEKLLKLKILSGKKTMQPEFRFRVKKLKTPNPSATWQITADTPYLNQVAGGQAFVYYGAGHTSLVDPVIIIEGFDIYDEYNWPELYDFINQENLLEDLVSLGFDAIILNFDDPVTYVQRNAFLVMKLIQLINDSVSYSKQALIIGSSMGGLCSRYALNYMEQNALNHNVRTFISFDSPQQGANIPLGIQFWIHFYAGESADAAYLDGRLLSPAAKQMLQYHYTQSGYLQAAPDMLFPQMMTEFIQLGDYPQNVRKVAIINGSGTSANQGFSPANQILQYEYYSALISLVGNCWAVPTLAQTTVFYGLIDRPWPFSDDQQTVAVNPCFPLDNCPGGYKSTMLDMQNQNAPYGSIVALHDSHCFIPTISGLDIDTANYFYNAQADTGILSRTPFDMVYFPTVNEEHIHVSPASKNWFIKEIMHLITSLDEQPEIEFTVFPNPSTGQVNVQISKPGRYNLKVFNMDGSLYRSQTVEVFSENQKYITLNIVDPGFYFINLKGINQSFTTKLIILE